MPDKGMHPAVDKRRHIPAGWCIFCRYDCIQITVALHQLLSDDFDNAVDVLFGVLFGCTPEDTAIFERQTAEDALFLQSIQHFGCIRLVGDKFMEEAAGVAQ